MSLTSRLRVLPSVRAALRDNVPVVALESSIMTQGLPWPENLTAARQCEEAILQQGAVPATCAIIDGVPVVGCAHCELEHLAVLARDGAKNLRKVARRDIGKCIADRACGGTTVSATLAFAAAAGIEVFATGGIGGVHRGFADSMDVSADIEALSRTRVLVVCAGIKTVLDVPRTLEAFESASVPVFALNPDGLQFPGFYVRDSGSTLSASSVFASEEEVAKVVFEQLGVGSGGILLAVPVPRQHEADSRLLASALRDALRKAREQAISGNAITPFLLGEIADSTQGNSLDANIELVRNNATVAARVSSLLCKARRGSQASSPSIAVGSADIVVAGGCAVDIVTSVRRSLVRGTSNPGQMSISFGGVGRNIAEAVAMSGASPILISAVGDDHLGSLVQSNLCGLGLSTEMIQVLETDRTATYVALSENGDLDTAVSDMTLFDEWMPLRDAKYLRRVEALLSRTKLLVLDGNLSVDCLYGFVSLARSVNVDVWYEPVSVSKGTRILERDMMSGVTYLSPNVDELVAMWKAAFKGGSRQNVDDMARDILSAHGGERLTLICTRGSKGLTVYVKDSNTAFSKCDVPAVPVPGGVVKSTSGAGDVLAGSVTAVLARKGRGALMEALKVGVQRAAECCAAEASSQRRAKL